MTLWTFYAVPLMAMLASAAMKHLLWISTLNIIRATLDMKQ